MLLYNEDDMNLFLDSNCEGIISFIVGPIHKKHYEIICYEKNKTFFLLYAKIDVEMMLEFAKDYCSNKTTFEEFHTEICKKPIFVEAYKNKFMTEIDVFALREELLQIKNFKGNSVQVNNCEVLDGFSMDCKIFATNEKFHIKDFSKSKEYQGIIELANRVLEYLRIEDDKRFVIINES